MASWSRRSLALLVVGVLAVGCGGSAGSAAPTSVADTPSMPAASAPVASPVSPASTQPTAGTPAPGAVDRHTLKDVAVRTLAVSVAWTAPFAVDKDGNLYLPTGTDGAALTKVAPDGTVLATWAGPDTVPGQPDTVSGVAIDAVTGDVWVSDATADQVVHLTSALEPVASFGGTGLGDGQFSSPGGLALLPDGSVAVADMGGNRVAYFTRDGAFIRAVDAPGGDIAPYDVAADAQGNTWVSGSQPGAFGDQQGMAVKLGPDGTVLQRLDTVPGGKTWFPSVAVSGSRVLVGDAWQGILELQPDGSLERVDAIVAEPTSAATVRFGADGNIYTLACGYASTDCMIVKRTPDGTQVANWHAIGSLPVPEGTTATVDGRDMFIKCLGSGSPTIVWISGKDGPGWRTTAQYLQSQLAKVSRVCVYDRPGLGFSSSAGYGDMTHWLNDTADLAALLEAAGVDDPLVMAGHSYGGLLARVFAYQHPDRVAGVLAVDPASEDQYSLDVPNPDVPADDPSCATCPFYPDIEAIHAMTKGKLAGSLGSLPLIVLSHAADLPFWMGAYEAPWLKLSGDTATASTNSRHVTASWSGHAIPTVQPALVVEAVRQLVAAATAKDHTLPACGEAMTSLGGVCD
jgi:pimeloyl-ACP methyl ester carboxylesterase/sugar lactone lactonase YvrE